ncbi:hypothetical protein [Streptomyces sp. NPDC057199]|uniref:hypothetical protein n=1 Tax=Streptomyces sp. NPDC057199 TaxID=3346047 RepID=UPI003643C93D
MGADPLGIHSDHPPALRGALNLSHVVLSAPVAVTAHPTPFASVTGTPLDESVLTRPATVRMTSVPGVDAAHLVLTDTDLADCLFSGAFHLDQLRLEGRTTLASTPTGWHHRGVWPVRWTRRRTLAEEHHWRAQAAEQHTPSASTPASSRQWRTGPHHPDPALTPDSQDVAALYRRLRKAFEDGKNEPGAADFHYGECAATTHPAARKASATCCGRTGCSPDPACAPPAPPDGSSPPCPSPCCS